MFSSPRIWVGWVDRKDYQNKKDDQDRKDDPGHSNSGKREHKTHRNRKQKREPGPRLRDHNSGSGAPIWVHPSRAGP